MNEIVALEKKWQVSAAGERVSEAVSDVERGPVAGACTIDRVRLAGDAQLPVVEVDRFHVESLEQRVEACGSLDHRNVPGNAVRLEGGGAANEKKRTGAPTTGAANNFIRPTIALGVGRGEGCMGSA